MNRRSFLKFCGIAPVVPMVAVEAIANNSAPIIFDPKSICGITGFVAGGYAGEMEIHVDSTVGFARSGYLRIENEVPIEYRITTSRKENVADKSHNKHWIKS